jgi:hypothetical protein
MSAGRVPCRRGRRRYEANGRARTRSCPRRGNRDARQYEADVGVGGVLLEHAAGVQARPTEKRQPNHRGGKRKGEIEGAGWIAAGYIQICKQLERHRGIGELDRRAAWVGRSRCAAQREPAGRRIETNGLASRGAPRSARPPPGRRSGKFVDCIGEPGVAKEILEAGQRARVARGRGELIPQRHGTPHPLDRNE